VAEEARPDGRELMRGFVGSSPFAQKLGIALDQIEDDAAVLRLPFDPSLATAGEVVHGGAIATLADTAATVAAWSAADVALIRNGATISLTVEYLAAATASDLVARGRVSKRGRTLVFCEVDVFAGGTDLVAKALATYRFALARGESK
jgi:uncharacterized protein (TIGR00369 family)